MNYNKKIIIAIGILFFALLLSLSIIKITINILYPGNELSDSIKESFKDSFGKAIKFDTLVFSYNGDIILQNFYLSNTSDFNDNINLIKCSNVEIDTSLIDLLRMKMTFSSVHMYNPEINIIKNYGKSYYDILIEDITAGIKKEKIGQFIKNKFSIELTDSKLFYREIFKNTRTNIDFQDVDISISYKNNKLTYDADGDILNKNISWWQSSSFSAEGTIQIDSNKSENWFKFKNIDISHLNNFIAENMNNPANLSGSISGKLNLTTNQDSFFVKGDIDTEEIYAVNKNQSSDYILKNENINARFSLSSTFSKDRIILHNLIIDDDIFRISMNFDFVKDDYLFIKTESNKINLDDLSYVFSPSPKYTYTGDLKFSGSCKYSFKEMKPEELSVDIKIDRFNFNPPGNVSNDITKISDCNAEIKADKDKFILKTVLKTGKTDLNISFTSFINNWKPFKSSNQLDIISKTMDISLLKLCLLSGINSIYNMAYVDMFQNFDEQRNFLKEPEGIFINNNDLLITVAADKLHIANDAALNNFNLKLNLTKGSVKTESFSLNGYEGIFTFDAHASLRQDYPYIKLEGGVENLNLTQISAASDSAIPAGGIMNAEFNYETNAFRIGQIVENGKGEFNLTIKDGYFSNTEKQKSINEFIKNNGYSESIPSMLTFRELSFEFHQSANEYYIRNFKLDSNSCSFSSYGKYLEDEGLDIPVNLNFVIDNNYTKVPLLLTGKLAAPCVKINSKKNKEELCF